MMSVYSRHHWLFFPVNYDFFCFSLSIYLDHFLYTFSDFRFSSTAFSVHTMEELKLTGNHLKGSRPLLTFSANFEKDAHWRLLKQMLLQVCGWFLSLQVFFDFVHLVSSEEIGNLNLC